MSQALHVKYRPGSFEEVVGQREAVQALASMLERRRMQTFMFSGPSGCGKTTLARIAAAELGCDGPANLIEINAATHTGIDAMREIQEVMAYTPFGEDSGRAVIIDEAHGLSKQAWDSLLKATEEPKDGVYWFFCTTNPAKMPTTMKTRCAAFALKQVRDEDLQKLIKRVCKEEGMKLPDGVVQQVIREAMGSPRQALVNLETVQECETASEAAKLLHSAIETDATLELCRFLVGGGSWGKAMAILDKLSDENPEGVRIVVCNYLASCLKSAKSDKQATHYLHILDQFSHPYNQSENSAPLFLSVGRSLYS